MRRMSNRDPEHTGGCDAVEGGYSIFIDGGTIASFMEAGDYSSARELRHFEEIAGAVGARATGEGGVTLMALSVTADRLSRDFAVLNIAHALAKQGRRVLIVDCDFLSPGLSGLVENVDSLGFLDLLLYGSSLKTVVRPTGIDGVGVTAPGSFPVTRTVPFAQKEFEKVGRHLRRASDVVIYCSTLYTEEGNVNPLAALVDGLVLACRIDEMEEGQLRRALGDLGSGLPPAELVCFCEPGEKRQAVPPVVEDERPAAPVEEQQAAVEPPAAAIVEPETSPGKPEFLPVDIPAEEDETMEEKPGTVNLPRIVTIAVVVIVAGFLAWWLVINRTAPDGDRLPAVSSGEARQPAGETEEPAGMPEEPGDVAVEQGGETGAGPGAAGTDAGETPPETAASTAVPPSEGGTPAVAGEAAETSIESAAGAAAAEGLYVVHVSSFRDETRAAREVAYLEENGWDARTVEVVIRGERWLRVIVGAYATPGEANEAKLELESLRRIADARVIKRPE